MNRSRWNLVASIVGLVALGCSSADNPSVAGGTGGTGGSGSNPLPVGECGKDCTTDLDAARSAMESGDFSTAFDLYECADTPEAAFGAGLARLLLMLEGEAATGILADLGLPPLEATDVMGPDSILSRLNERWDGEGFASVTGVVTANLTFDHGQQSLGDYPDFEAEDWASDANADLEIEFSDVAALGMEATFEVSYDCSLDQPTQHVDPGLEYVGLRFDAGDNHYSCWIPYYAAGGSCEADGGRVLITHGGNSPGDQIDYALNDLLLECVVSERGDDDPGYVGPAGTLPQIRVSGVLSAAAVAEDVDTAGLHPMFQEDFDIHDTLPASTTVTDLLQGAAGLTPDLEEAACFFARAGEGTGQVGTFPGALVAGPDVAISQGDAQVLGGSLLMLAATAEVVSAFGVPMALEDLICDDASASCPSEEELAADFNAVFASTFDAAPFAEAERLTTAAIPLLDAGLGHLDEDSLLVNNAESTAGLELMRDFVQAAGRSLEGSVALPHITPVLHVDLANFFQTARNPRDVDEPVLLVEEECDDWDCWSSTELNTDFLAEYFADTTDADWAGDTDYEMPDADEEAIDDALQEIGDSLSRHIMAGD